MTSLYSGSTALHGGSLNYLLTIVGQSLINSVTKIANFMFSSEFLNEIIHVLRQVVFC